jgi:hypothetical protein
MGRSHASDGRNSSARKGGGVDRIHLIELIEAQTARLSDEGRGLWEELEFLRESIPDPEEPSRMAREYDIMERIFELPVHQQFITSRLAELVGGLRAAEEAEHRGESGNGHRARGVINAAMLKDREQGRAIDAHMTIDRAITRLEERD